jgi:hypothetical protein
MKNYKIALITLVVSFNASADIFDDIGDWVEHNKTATAIVGVGALTAAAVAVKPLSGLFRAGEEEVVAGKVLAEAEGASAIAGAEAESLEVAASKLNVEEGATGGEIFNSFKGYKYAGDNKWVEEDLALEGATGKATTSKELSSFEKNVSRKDILKSLDGYKDKGYAEWIEKNAETEL